ncbi:hypothetical protein AB0F43_18285 [Kribbella sp. NPDC023972]|uniref:hypothetical protein n=1 Tax=Kribbella sp. NPDC023972 TaxID=3154795 RepID=UPI0033CDCB23
MTPPRNLTPARTARLLAGAAGGALLLSVTLPAAAETAADSPATLTVTGGVLALTAPTASANLGSRANTVGGGTISGPLGTVQVSDARSAAAGTGWVASVISTAFTPTTGPAIPATGIGYTVGAITKVGTATYTANDPGVIVASSSVVTATAITGDNSATWNPTINVTVPGGMAPAVYSGTITHSVL